MPLQDIVNQIRSWLGTYSDRYYQNRQAIYSIRIQFKNTFGFDPIKVDKHGIKIKRHSKKSRFKKRKEKRKKFFK